VRLARANTRVRRWLETTPCSLRHELVERHLECIGPCDIGTDPRRLHRSSTRRSREVDGSRNQAPPGRSGRQRVTTILSVTHSQRSIDAPHRVQVSPRSRSSCGITASPQLRADGSTSREPYFGAIPFIHAQHATAATRAVIFLRHFWSSTGGSRKRPIHDGLNETGGDWSSNGQ